MNTNIAPTADLGERARALGHDGPVAAAWVLAVPAYNDARNVAGTRLVEHALAVAEHLARLRLDPAALAAALLMHAPAAGLTTADIAAACGDSTARLTDGLAKLGLIHRLGVRPSPVPSAKDASPRDAAAQLEHVRQMLLAMAEDVRVVVIKLAERAQLLRELGHAADALRRPVAEEVRAVFAPLANRLGLWQLKWELEDYACRFLEPEAYKRVAGLLDQRRAERETFIGVAVAALRQELSAQGLRAEVAGRPKHIASILNKMHRKGVDFDALYDVHALRVLVDDVKDCYAALGVVHNLWVPISGEFDDYISHPKANDYRSLHTAVIGPEGRALEVQIRTHEMHRHAELGVAAHWRYKEGGGAHAELDRKLTWLRQLLEWKEDLSDSHTLVEQFVSEIFQDNIYVLTPQGRVIELPQGATPVDFAYHVHTDLGDRCRGAKVNGRMVPLHTKLRTGSRVEIVAAKAGGPSRDWLNPALGYLASARARAKVRQWFKRQHFEANVAQGKAEVEREARRLGVSEFNQEKLAQHLHFAKPDEFYAAVGRGDLSHMALVHALQDDAPPLAPAPKRFTRLADVSGADISGADVSGADIRVEGVAGLATTFAKCCDPKAPEPIAGYLSHVRGVVIHRRGCPHVQTALEQQPERVLAASWGEARGYVTEVRVDAEDRTALLRDISEVFARERIHVTAVNVRTEERRAHMRFLLEVADFKQLSGLLARVQEVPGVSQVLRAG